MTLSTSSRKSLIIILAVSVVLRVLLALYQGNEVEILPGTYDQISYDSLARRVATGYGFSFAENHWPVTRAGEPTAHWSYFYTLYLAGLYSLFGATPLLPRLLQAVIVGVLHGYVTYRITEKIFATNVGLIAAGVVSLYLYFVYYSGSLMTESFYITAILYSLYFAMQMAESDGGRQDLTLAAALGVAISITVLLRQVFLLFIPFLFLWIWIARFTRKKSLPLLPSLLAIGLVVLSILPFSLYNQTRFGRFVLLNTNSGYAFYWGNHPIYGNKFIPILPEEMGTYGDLLPKELIHLDEAALDQELLDRGIQFIVDDPGRYVLLSISRIPAYFMFWPTSDSGVISNVSRVGSFGLLLPFMIYGLILAIKRLAAKQGNFLLNLVVSPEGLLMLFALIYTSIHLLTWALVRYRLPVDAVLVPFAALALYRFYPWAVEKIKATR